MNTSPRSRRAPRQALAAVATVAGAVLLLAPVAGASVDQQPPAVANEEAHEHSNADDAPPAQPGTPNEAADARSEQRDENAVTPGPNANAVEQRDENAETPGPNANAVEQRNENADTRGPNGNADRPTPNNGSAEPESPGASGEHKQTICHRTRSATNPYVKITVDFHAVDGELIESNGDHAGQHDTVAVFDPEIHSNGGDWGDIIPMFTFEGETYPGLNWGPEGQAIFENDCDLPTEDTTVVEEEEEEDVIVGGEEIDVEGDNEENVDGEVVVTAPTVDVPQQTPAAPQLNVPGEVGETAVLGATVTRSPGADAAVAGATTGTLPRTGAGTGLLAALGAALLGAGFTLQKSSRRLSVTD